MQSVKLVTAAFLAMAVLGGPALAGPDTNTSGGLTIQGAGLAVHGYDPVAYFTEGRPVIGSAQFATVHNEATYRFASEENLKTFESDPERYAPQFGGFCAYGVAVGAKFDGDPQFWEIVDGKLYLNLNHDIQKTWSKDKPSNIDKAEDNWKEIADKIPAELS